MLDIDIRGSLREDLAALCAPYNKQELRSQLRALPLRKAAGEDGIANELLARLDESYEARDDKAWYGDRVLEYAQRLVSTPGGSDGLYWKADSGEEPPSEPDWTEEPTSSAPATRPAWAS